MIDLICACQQPLPERARLGIELFNQKRFFEAHEELELAWRAESGPVRNLYQGILQIGVAYLQIQRKNYLGARKMFLRAWNALEGLPDQCQGIDLIQLKTNAALVEQSLIQLGPKKIELVDLHLLKPILFTLTPGVNNERN